MINCHAEGMDSIVFRERAPMIRAFVARPEHTMWRNSPTSGQLFSVAIHMHRQDITMVPLFGKIYNLFPDVTGHAIKLYAFNYSSQIADGKGGFAKDGGGRPCRVVMSELNVPTKLRGLEYHSVYVPRGEAAAWLICEGSPNPHYSSACLSNDPELDKTDFSSLYKPMTAERLAEDMKLIESMG